jgi:hypothetical protein
LITLLAGLALAGVLITLSMNATRKADLAAGAANAPAAQNGGAASDVSPENPADEEAPDDAQPDDAQPDDATPPPEAGDADEDADAAPAEPAARQNVTWAGRMKGGDATIAITAKGDKAIAYVCDGEDIEAWLQGTAVDGELDLAAAAKSKTKAKLTGTFGNGRAKGSVTVDGTKFTFDVGTVKKPSGLYRATTDVRGARLDGGWIVLADGTQVGLATFAGSPVPVGRLDLNSRTTTIFGERITASPVTPGAGS